MTIAEAVEAWLQHEETIRYFADELGGPLADQVDELYDTLQGNAPLRRKGEACRQLYKLERHALANVTTKGPTPHVPPSAWQWGRPGSAEDLELLEAGRARGRRRRFARARRRRRQRHR